MTEEDAKKRWCPMARSGYAGEVGEISNRAAFNKQFDGACLSSDCMMWQWDITPARANSLNVRGDHDAYPSGYCGLGGRP